MSEAINRDIYEIVQDKNLFLNLKESTVLITGATGVAGSMLLRSLLAANDRYHLDIMVKGTARNRGKVNTVLGAMTGREDLEIIYTENLNIDTYCDYIVHTVCPTKSRFFIENPVETINVSLWGTRRMLELAKKNKVRRMVYLSSMEQYGIPFEKDQIMTEERSGIVNHLTARGSYPESKRMGECYCAAYAHEYGVRTSIARLAQTFGAGVSASDNRVFMQFARSVISETDIILHTAGESLSNYCYITDTVTGILTILAKGKSGEAYNICNDSETRTIKEIAQMVAQKLAHGKIKVMTDDSGADKYGYSPDTTIRLNSDKLQSLGWESKIGMEEAYRRLVSFLKEKDRYDISVGEV